MNEGDLVIENMNVLNNVISQLLFVDIKINEKGKCINLLFSFPNSWDSFVMAIENNNTKLDIFYMVAKPLSEEMRHKNME